jgi:hypothetical protein
MGVEVGKPGGLTITQDYKVLKAIELCENTTTLNPDWRTVQDAVVRRLRWTCPSVLKAFDIGFRLEPGVLDDHLAPVYTPRSAVDQLADVAEGV